MEEVTDKKQPTKKLDTEGLNELIKQIATVFSNLNKQVDDLQKQVDEFVTANEVDLEFES